MTVPKIQTWNKASVAAGVAAMLSLPFLLTACGAQETDLDAKESVEAVASSSAAPTSKVKTSTEAKKSEEKADKETSAKSTKDKSAAGDKPKTKAKEPSSNKESSSEGNAQDKAQAGGAAGSTDSSQDSRDSSEQLQEALKNEAPQAELTELGQGEAADPKTEKQIKNLVNGLYKTKTVKDAITYLPKNTCESVLAEQGGEAAVDTGEIPQHLLDMPANTLMGNNSVQSIENIRVNGNQASAVVTISTPSGPDTAVQQYLKEGGSWKYCRF